MTFGGLEAHNVILGIHNFRAWFGLPANITRTRGGLKITLMEVFDASSSWKDDNWYSEGRQGWEGESHLIFKVEDLGDGTIRFFKKEGTCDSYGSNSWDGPFCEVIATPKTIQVWEFK